LGASRIGLILGQGYNPYRSCPYHVATHVENPEDPTNPDAAIILDTWQKVNDAFADNVGPSDFPNPDYGGTYRAYGLAACSFLTEVTNGYTAWSFLDTHVHLKPDLPNDPTWASCRAPLTFWCRRRRRTGADLEVPAESAAASRSRV
jgi:hypothetical protein